jgi:hypothetical protein
MVSKLQWMIFFQNEFTAKPLPRVLIPGEALLFLGFGN